MPSWKISPERKEYMDMLDDIRSLAKTAKAGIIIEGPKNISDEAARAAAKAVLCTANGSDGCTCNACRSFDAGNNPDFSIIKKDKSVISIDLVREIKADTVPVVSRKKVVYVPDFGTATEEAQNAVLKVLEDDADKICVICTFISGKILQTVKSRMAVKKLKPANTKGREYVLTGGDTGNVNECFENVLAAFEAGSARKFLESLNVFKEKDKKDYFSVYKTDGVRDLCALLERAASSDCVKWSGLIKRCGEEEARIGNSYGKLQFYAFCAEISEMIERRNHE